MLSIDRYGRHVAIPWSTLLPAIPHVVPPGSMNATQDWEPEPASASPTLASFTQPSLAPCMAMRNLVQNYVRHAGNQLDVRASFRFTPPLRMSQNCTRAVGMLLAGKRVLLPLLALPRQRLRYRNAARHVHNLWLRPCVFRIGRLHGRFETGVFLPGARVTCWCVILILC